MLVQDFNVVYKFKYSELVLIFRGKILPLNSRLVL